MQKRIRSSLIRIEFKLRFISKRLPENRSFTDERTAHVSQSGEMESAARKSETTSPLQQFLCENYDMLQQFGWQYMDVQRGTDVKSNTGYMHSAAVTMLGKVVDHTSGCFLLKTAAFHKSGHADALSR